MAKKKRRKKSTRKRKPAKRRKSSARRKTKSKSRKRPASRRKTSKKRRSKRRAKRISRVKLSGTIRSNPKRRRSKSRRRKRRNPVYYTATRPDIGRTTRTGHEWTEKEFLKHKLKMEALKAQIAALPDAKSRSPLVRRLSKLERQNEKMKRQSWATQAEINFLKSEGFKISKAINVKSKGRGKKGSKTVARRKRKGRKKAKKAKKKLMKMKASLKVPKGLRVGRSVKSGKSRRGKKFFKHRTRRVTKRQYKRNPFGGNMVEKLKSIYKGEYGGMVLGLALGTGAFAALSYLFRNQIVKASAKLSASPTLAKAAPVVPYLIPVLGVVGLQMAYKKTGNEMLKKVAHGLAAATIVGGTSALIARYMPVASGVAGLPVRSGMGVVDYTPMSGVPVPSNMSGYGVVDYTPEMAGYGVVDYTPEMSGEYAQLGQSDPNADFGMFDQLGQYKQASSDFGQDTADFGAEVMMSDFGDASAQLG